jgi:hypothetical protein
MGSENDKTKKGNIAAIAWNGIDKPFAHISFDESPSFHILLFNYSGNGRKPPASDSYQYDFLVNKRTEFKGHLLHELYTFLKGNDRYEYIGIIDDDIQVQISGINEMLAIAEADQLDAFQPSLTRNSYHSFQFNLHQPGKRCEPVAWVEIMCPFYRKKLFDACYPLCEKNISSYGIDKYAIPFYQHLLDMRSTAVVHAVQATHLKPITDGDKRFSNGFTARQEGEGLRKKILQLIDVKYADKFPESTVAFYFGNPNSFFSRIRNHARVFLKDIKNALVK